MSWRCPANGLEDKSTGDSQLRIHQITTHYYLLVHAKRGITYSIQQTYPAVGDPRLLLRGTTLIAAAQRLPNASGMLTVFWHPSLQKRGPGPGAPA